jgi:hypothetical protein
LSLAVSKSESYAGKGGAGRPEMAMNGPDSP